MMACNFVHDDAGLREGGDDFSFKLKEVAFVKNCKFENARG